MTANYKIFECLSHIRTRSHSLAFAQLLSLEERYLQFLREDTTPSWLINGLSAIFPYQQCLKAVIRKQSLDHDIQMKKNCMLLVISSIITKTNSTKYNDFRMCLVFVNEICRKTGCLGSQMTMYSFNFKIHMI